MLLVGTTMSQTRRSFLQTASVHLSLSSLMAQTCLSLPTMSPTASSSFSLKRQKWRCLLAINLDSEGICWIPPTPLLVSNIFPWSWGIRLGKERTPPRSAISLIDLTYPYVYIQTVVQSTQKKSFLTNYENVSLRPSSESSESSSASSPYKEDGTWYQWSTPASISLQRSKRHPHLRQANSTRATFKSYVNLNITWSVGGCYNVDKTFVFLPLSSS